MDAIRGGSQWGIEKSKLSIGRCVFTDIIQHLANFVDSITQQCNTCTKVTATYKNNTSVS